VEAGAFGIALSCPGSLSVLALIRPRCRRPALPTPAATMLSIRRMWLRASAISRACGPTSIDFDPSWRLSTTIYVSNRRTKTGHMTSARGGRHWPTRKLPSGPDDVPMTAQQNMLLSRVVNREARSGSRCDEIRTRASQQGLGGDAGSSRKLDSKAVGWGVEDQDQFAPSQAHRHAS
jgi:hypothetical protein